MPLHSSVARENDPPQGALACPVLPDERLATTHATAPTACLHCGTPLGADDPRGDGFCCEGCRAVRMLLEARGLERYYDLRNGAGNPVAVSPSRTRDLKWLEALEAQVAGAANTTRVEMDLQGLSCAACVWLLEALFRRQPDAKRVLINPALGKAELWVGPAFPLRAYVEDVERFGYLFGPALKQSAPRAASGLLARIGVCAFLAMNAMLFGIPLYLGLRTGVVYQVFRGVTFALATTSLLVGGSVFIKSAWQGLRRRVLHLDVPIALGIVLAYAGSTYAFVTGREGQAYFDTLTVFIALMLVGRWLQERVLDRNRRFLLASDGIDGLFARRVREGAVELVRCRELQAGDTVLVAPGDLVPVPALLADATASCSLDWITGESAPAPFRRGEEIPAGAFNLGASAITLHAVTAFDGSPLVGLLRSTVARDADAARATPWWQRLARVYTVAVLLAATAGFALWYALTGDLARALGVTTAILVVTCPCAFGIATPMAYELAQAGLRRAGLFVRSAGFLDRATAVRRVVFDKTGTLTTGVLALADTAPLTNLTAREREVLYNLAARSTHPRSAAVARALTTRERAGDTAPQFIRGLEVTEVPGRGLEAVVDGARYRLGAPGWAAAEKFGASDSVASADLYFGVDGALRAALATREEVRPDAAHELARLTREGYEVWVLSGDAPARVTALATSLGVPAARAVGGQGPHEKAAWLGAHDRADTLMIGDGINDGPAAERAFCSGTPAIDRPFMPARTDFYFVSAGLRPVGLALRAARALARVNRRNLGVAVAYNVATVALCFAGWMSPLLCAVVMPATSLSILLGTIASLSPGRSLWTSS